MCVYTHMTAAHAAVISPLWVILSYPRGERNTTALPLMHVFDRSCNSEATILNVEVSDDSKFTISGSGNIVPANSAIDTWKVQPNVGLSAGEHTATITVTYNNNATAEADVKFKVTGAAQASLALEVTTEAAPVTIYLVTVNGGIGGGSYAEDATVTITADAAPDGQRFTGWTVNAGGVILTNASNATTTFTVPAQAVIVTANFETIITPPTEYTVTFDAQGGNVAPATMKTTVGKLQSLPVPTKSSHTFEGWFTQSSGGEKITVDNVFTADTTIYAHWKYTVGNSGNNSGGYTPSTTTYPPTVEKPQGAAERRRFSPPAQSGETP